jgi:hypothetical protein
VVWVFLVNLEVCRFACKTIYAARLALDVMVEAFASESPVR